MAAQQPRGGTTGSEPTDWGDAAGGAWRTGPRSRVRRLPERARYDRESVQAILDEGFVCHLGYCGPDGPVVVPTGYARVGDHLYLHGAAANHALRTVATGIPVCCTVTLVDGIVLARSAFHHSINYRSVVVYGRADEVRDPAEKRAVLDAVVEHIVPGRSADARRPDDVELLATRVVRITIEEASAKVRTGGPKEEPEDLAAGGTWAGVLPFTTVVGPPVPDDQGELPPVPAYVTGYTRPGWG